MLFHVESRLHPLFHLIVGSLRYRNDLKFIRANNINYKVISRALCEYRMKLDKAMKPLLGIHQKKSLTFIDDNILMNNFVELIIETVRRYHFDGLFFYFDGEQHYKNYRFEKFLHVCFFFFLFFF